MPHLVASLTLSSEHKLNVNVDKTQDIDIEIKINLSTTLASCPPTVPNGMTYCSVLRAAVRDALAVLAHGIGTPCLYWTDIS